VPNQIRHSSLLTRVRPCSYRKAIDPQNCVRKLKSEQKHKSVQAKSSRTILRQPKSATLENGNTELAVRLKSKSNLPDQTNKASRRLTHISTSTFPCMKNKNRKAVTFRSWQHRPGREQIVTGFVPATATQQTPKDLRFAHSEKKKN
jgi:hypothetical protein